MNWYVRTEYSMAISFIPFVDASIMFFWYASYTSCSFPISLPVPPLYWNIKEMPRNGRPLQPSPADYHMHKYKYVPDDSGNCSASAFQSALHESGYPVYRKNIVPAGHTRHNRQQFRLEYLFLIPTFCASSRAYCAYISACCSLPWYIRHVPFKKEHSLR